MDIGAGTGILSIFAAKAGAKHVYAIEYAEIAIFAKEIIKQDESCQDRFFSERVLKIFANNNVEISLNSSLIVKEKCLSILMD